MRLRDARYVAGTCDTLCAARASVGWPGGTPDYLEVVRLNVHSAQLDLLVVLDRAAPEQMHALCEAEQCTVAALASHVAGGHVAISNWVAVSAKGDPLPAIAMDDINAMNAAQFAGDADRPKEEILAELRANGAEAARFIRSHDDSALDRSQYFALLDREVSTEWLVQNILINELSHHPASIRAASEPVIGA